MKLRIVKRSRYSNVFEEYREVYDIQEFYSHFWPLRPKWHTEHTVTSEESARADVARRIRTEYTRTHPDEPQVVYTFDSEAAFKSEP